MVSSWWVGSGLGVDVKQALTINNHKVWDVGAPSIIQHSYMSVTTFGTGRSTWSSTISVKIECSLEVGCDFMEVTALMLSLILYDTWALTFNNEPGNEHNVMRTDISRKNFGPKGYGFGGGAGTLSMDDGKGYKTNPNEVRGRDDVIT